jgi:hypothetical protein
MKRLIELVKNPLVYFAALLVFMGFYQAVCSDKLDTVIRSDGRGYYAYLPAVFIYNDATFQASMEVEKRSFPLSTDQLYLYKDEHGNFYNKYFPGIAVMQLPFFGMACLASWLLGYPVDGYNTVFYFFFFLGALFYAIAGMLLFSRVLKMLFPSRAYLVQWIVPIIYMASTLLFYSFDTPSFSHLYSFFLFGLFSLTVLSLKKEQTFLKFIFLGLIVGLIVLVRPTNGLVLVAIPFLLADVQSFRNFLRQLVEHKARHFFAGFFGFSIIMFIQLLCWKWQSGDWVKWSYNGEGFNFFQTPFFSGFFSFRIGLFLHAPMLILSIAGIISIAKKNTFQFVAYGLYFLVNSWVILSWWCWDYESNFGPRPFTEHLFFLSIPVVYFMLNFPKWIVVSAIGLITLNGGIRYMEVQGGFMKDQRFTKANFLPSLEFWNKNNHGRWNFTRSVVPHGNLIHKELLLDKKGILKITPHDLFPLGVEKPLEKPRTNERMYYRVKLDKRQNEEKFENVFLVIDAYTEDQKKRYYRAIDLFNDRLEGQENWAHLEFEGQVYDNLQEYDFVKIYIWNLGAKTFLIKDVEMVFETYKK